MKKVKTGNKWPKYLQLASSTNKHEISIAGLNDCQQRYRPMVHLYLNRQPLSGFSMINSQRLQLRFIHRYGNMSGSVMAEQQHIIIKIHGIGFRKRSSETKRIQDLHSLHIFYFHFACNRNV